MLGIGEQFPNFSLPNQEGENRTLSNYEGKWLVLYTYPKDDTPGCTIQGKSFTATRDQFNSENAVVVGLNADDVNSHKMFCNKYSFTIDLLSDSKAQLLERMGVGQKTFKGSLYWNRMTFLIDPQGVVQKIYPNVNPEGHEKTVLEDIRNFKKT